ncbi:MAG: hypothetical protein ISS69_13480 [Phycisphaerae bacterium]|nr:hypothetical protein [Phycisphaerae bacterium]
MNPIQNSASRAVVFLDLLGFRRAVMDYPSAAIGLLQDYSDSLNIKLCDAKLMSEQQEASPEIKRLNYLSSTDSFETFLPMSDSIFIVSSSPSDLVLQLSHFLWDCLQPRWLAFTKPENPASPTTVNTQTIDLVSNETIKNKETWLPVLFRGGISWGQVTNIKAFSIVEGKEVVGANLIGEAVASSVGLEQKKPKGPRILLSDQFFEQVNEEARCYVAQTPDLQDTYELLWPMALMETSSDLQDALDNELGQLLRGIVALLLSHPADTKTFQHYLAFLGLTIRAGMQKYPCYREQLRKKVRQLLIEGVNASETPDKILDEAFGETPVR